MPVKNAPTTTWYKPPPIHHAPGGALRHSPQQVTNPQSRPGVSQVPGHHQQVPNNSPNHMPAISPSGLPCHSSQPLKQATQVPSSQVPPSGSRVPGHSTHVPPLLPSKLPTSTSSSTSSSPKRSIPQSKIVSPTRLRNADRLPPISKGTTPLTGAEQCDVTVLKPVTSGQKVKGKDVKEAKEKLNENRIRRSSSEGSHLKKGNRENARKVKSDNEGTATKKKNFDNKLETKSSVIIPKRKKSERSNSDNEIKPKKLNVKELPAISSEVEEMQEKTTITTTTTTAPTTTTTDATTTFAATKASSKDSSNKSQDKTTSKPSKPNRKVTVGPGSSSSSSSVSTSSNHRCRPPSPQLSRKDPVKDVEKMLKEMDVGKETEKDIDETDLGKSIERSLECHINAQAENAMECTIEKVHQPEEEDDAEAMVCDDDDDDAKDVFMEDESVEGEYNVEEEEKRDDEEKVSRGGEECVSENAHVAKDSEELEDSPMSSESVISVLENVIFPSESHRPCGSFETARQVDAAPPASLLIDDAEDAATDQSMRDEDSIRDDRSMVDVVEISEHLLSEGHVDVDLSMDDSTLIVELALDGTVDDVILMDDAPDVRGTSSVAVKEKEQREEEGGEEEMKNIGTEGMVKTAVEKIEKLKVEDELLERDNIQAKGPGCRLKFAPKNAKKVPEKVIKKDLAVKRDAKICDDAKNKKKEEEITTLSERRSKRKMDTEKARGGTKKPAMLFVDKDVDKLATTSRPVSPCPSDVSSSSDQSHTSNLSHVSSRLPIRALHVSGPAHVGSVTSLCSTASGEGGDSRGSRDSRVLTSNRVNINNGEKKRSESSVVLPRRPRLDNVKSTIPKIGRLPPRKLTDPVKAARPGGPISGPRGPHHVGHGGSGGPGQLERHHPVSHAEQLRRLEAELTARATELKAARAERQHAEKGVEALTVLIHHLTNNYEPFSCPRLKAEVVRLNQQLTETRLSLDESTAAVRRLQEEAAQSVEQHGQKVQELEKRHRQALEQLTKQHQHDLDLAIEKHRKETTHFAEEQQTQREDLSRAHAAELERLEGEWRTKLDVQHEKHLCAVQELNTQHTHQLRELESSRQAREFELEEANHRLQSEQEVLKAQSKKLEETLLNDTDHRLQAVRNMCSSLRSEVDSLKTVVEMKNSEIHTLRGQVAEMGRLSKDLEVARDRARSLQAKTEDLQAQMEKRALSERHLVNEHRLLVETCQREANINKRLSLENEELAWKLRQREEMYTSLPSSTLDLVSRSPATPRRQEGAPSPQAAPHSPRVAVRSPSGGKISPSKCEVNKRRSRLGLGPEDGLNGDDRVQDGSIDSPPPSPCVKAVVEKSNSVSFILDLNDSQSDDSFLDLPPSPRPRPQRTASLSAADRPRTPIHARRVVHNNRANSLNRNGVNLEGRQKDIGKSEFNGKRKEVNGKSHDTNGHGSQASSGRSASESSEGGSEMERVSPTGLAWTVPVHSPKSPVKNNSLRQNGSPVRGRLEHHLLEDPDEDEYEETPEGTHQFIEVVELSRVGLASSSEAASDSELSQCDLIKGGSSTDSDSESSDGEPHTQQGSTKHREPLGRKNGPWCPKEGAGEAMITDDLLKQYPGDPLAIEPLPSRGKRPPRRCFPSAPSSDSDDNMNAHHEGTAVDVSWSEDITSSSEMHEL